MKNSLSKTLPSAKPQHLAALKVRRQRWLQVHLYLGLVGGSIFVLISLSGSLIVFAAQLDAWLNAEIMQVSVPSTTAKFRPVDEIIASAMTAMPKEGTFAHRLSFPQSAVGWGDARNPNTSAQKQILNA